MEQKSLNSQYPNITPAIFISLRSFLLLSAISSPASRLYFSFRPPFEPDFFFEMNVEYVKAKISVWWNIDDCKFPTSLENVSSIANNIRLALSKANLHGELSISAYGDTNRITSEILNALSSTGISVHHVTKVSDSCFDECYKRIITDMSMWALDNPNANVLLIFGDGCDAVPIVSRALHKLSMRNHNILLAFPSQVDASLTAAANIVWLWPALFSGGSPMPIEQWSSEQVQKQGPGGESDI